MDSIASFDVKSLRKVQTRVRTSDGRRYVETRDDAGEPRATSSPRFDGHPGYVVDLQPDLQIGQVLPGLYIGSQDVAADLPLLKARGVTHVVNAAAATVPNFHEGNGVTYLPLELLDLPEFTLTRDTIDLVCDFIETALSAGGAVFVHCNAGISRSGALVVAFLILRCGMSLAEALAKARAARPLVRPNDGFMRQLAELQSGMDSRWLKRERRGTELELRVTLSLTLDGSLMFQRDLQIGEVIPGLFIGSQDAAADLPLLQARGVTHVVNAAAISVPDYHEGSGLTYLPLQMHDLPSFTITRETFQVACDFIEQALSSGGAVFVHCVAGISRSGALVVAYLMVKRGMSLHEALSRARAARPVVNPNDGFMQQLAELERSLRQQQDDNAEESD